MYLFNKVWSGPALSRGDVDLGSLAILTKDRLKACLTSGLTNLTPQVPPKMATPWYGWSRMT